MEFLLSVASVGMLCYLSGCLSLKRDYMKCLVLGLSAFFCEYVVVAGILLAFDWFYVDSTLWVLFGMNLVLLVLIARKHTFKAEPFQLKKHSVFLIVFVLLIPVYLSGNGFFGMEQDQGVYQTKALFLMKDKTERQIYYDEIELIDSKKEKEAFVDDVFRYPGFDRYEDRWWFNSEEDQVNDTSGLFHGVQTFPALLAWSGTLFGVENMMLCQMFFLFLYLALVSFLCDEIISRQWVKIPALVVIGFSPVVIWVAKAALTEMFLGLLLILFFYLLKEGKGKKIWYTLIPLVTYSFYHVTIYTMMPMFVCIYLLYYLKSGEKRYMYVSMANILAYLAGFFAMLRVNPVYTENNYFNGVGFLPFLTIKNLPIFICIVCGVMLLLYFILLKIKIPKEEWLNRFLSGRIFKIGVLVLLLLCVLLILKRKDCPVQNLNIVGYVMMSGVITIPVIGGLFLWKFLREKNFFSDIFKLVIFFGFFYMVILYSAVFRVEIPYYYYYARYLVPYIAIVVLVFAYLADKIKWPFLAAITVLAGAFYVKYDMVLYKQSDDTRVSWREFTAVLDCLEEEGNTAVLINERVGNVYRLAVKGWTDADTYLIYNDLEEKLGFCDGIYDTIYYITAEEADLGNRKGENVLHVQNKYCEDIGEMTGKTTKLPAGFTEEKKDQYVYKITPICLEYEMTDREEFKNSGLGVVEGDFAWMNEEEAVIECILCDDSDYTLSIVQGCGIPFSSLNRGITLEVYFNGNPAGSFRLDEDTQNDTFDVEIPKEWVLEGKNEVTLRVPDRWSTTEYGGQDDRQLGIALKELLFKKH